MVNIDHSESFSEGCKNFNPVTFFVLAFFGVGAQNSAKIQENFDYLRNIHNVIDQD